MPLKVTKMQAKFIEKEAIEERHHCFNHRRTKMKEAREDAKSLLTRRLNRGFASRFAIFFEDTRDFIVLANGARAAIIAVTLLVIPTHYEVLYS